MFATALMAQTPAMTSTATPVTPIMSLESKVHLKDPDAFNGTS